MREVVSITMSVADTQVPTSPRPTVFLSYASEDRSAAQALRDALPRYGLEVWYDESDLIGGDAWDQKIRRQIRECDYFMPVVSANTEARNEGYFRREWRLAVERTLDMADDHIFILPVVIDETAQAHARVPEKFLAVQWLRVPGGQPTSALEALCQRLATGQAPLPQSSRKIPERPVGYGSRGPGAPDALGVPGTRGTAGAAGSAGSSGVFPEFPREEPGQKMRFGAQVVGWAFQSAWIAFKRLPKWVRIIVHLWVAVVLLAKACTPPSQHADRITSEQARRLAQIPESSSQSWSKQDIANFVAQIAKAIPGAAEGALGAQNALLAIPFTAPSGDPTAQKVGGSIFAQVYARVALARHGHVGLTGAPATLSPETAADLGRAQHSKYVIYGTVDGPSNAPALSVNVLKVADGSTAWSQSYPVAGADPARIAADVLSNLPETDD